MYVSVSVIITTRDSDITQPLVCYAHKSVSVLYQ